ncbi:cyclic nucleotide-binding domain-containing protein [Agrobacterium tumefaciens]|jgi:CRP-like cAMP-binding protein|uniref:Cyclic nucleotide-binding domain-containing protein n=2 Tax=Rhizobium/Agrobacterium group TaxID=227290 RepID=A0AA92H8V6_RHIRH|nr:MULTISPECIES: cyclic nucleotide-binding domain-containing protein [Rhizobium/Agrobacterium group]KQM31441.1 cyclic nucleotide-binding protein [Rhizobium sp. Leaf202]KQN82544.1 cyclic nucleotide-binding protein [Rhizobium sp. Leaf68]KQR36566.1 cyclic nucleotide-binding protein [Rhizobium sp. Leaf155]KRA03946.1 cyclic nucleotide-binding protein [Rhizobium sp. Root564]MDP9573742.1 CRP-like cAMP-binding protein [Agrobacterium larrymoorei]MQB22789.1 cyclic nucleotide-binding domain-containing p
MLFKDEIQMLKRVPFFSEMEPSKLKLLAFASDRVSYLAGDELFRQGDIGDSAYVLLTGKVDVLIDSPSGQIKLTEMSGNAIVGEIAILCDSVRTATVKASTPVEALRIGKEQFFKLMSDFPEITIKVMRVLAERLTQTTTELSKARAHSSV